MRYADDGNIYVRSQRAGQRVMESVKRFITQKLKLKVNEAKSAVARPRERKFLGFSFTTGPEIKRTIAVQADNIEHADCRSAQTKGSSTDHPFAVSRDVLPAHLQKSPDDAIEEHRAEKIHRDDLPRARVWGQFVHRRLDADALGPSRDLPESSFEPFQRRRPSLAVRNVSRRQEPTRHHGEDSLVRAKEFAEDWYFELRGKGHRGELRSEKRFQEAADQFTREYGVITDGQRSAKWVEGHQIRLRLHLLPFFGELGLSEMTTGKVQEYRVHRMTEGKPPARSTLHDADPWIDDPQTRTALFERHRIFRLREFGR